MQDFFVIILIVIIPNKWFDSINPLTFKILKKGLNKMSSLTLFGGIKHKELILINISQTCSLRALLFN